MARYPASMENPFWAAMLSNPKDSLPRLVFCDWLEEMGEVERSMLLRYSHGFSSVCVSGGDSGIGNGNGAGDSGAGAGDGVGDCSYSAGDGGYGVGVYRIFHGEFIMSNGYYLVYFPTGYYPLVQVGYVTIEGPELIIHGSRVVANSGVGSDWAGLAHVGPERARLHPAAKQPVTVPRQCVVHPLNLEAWAASLPDAMQAEKEIGKSC